jgi:hypothetical protein
MIEILTFASNNSLIAGVIVVVVIGFCNWAWRAYRDYSDSKKIYSFLALSMETTGYKFRSTETIAANTRLPEDRVAKLCGVHAKIRRNEKEKQSWQLHE